MKTIETRPTLLAILEKSNEKLGMQVLNYDHMHGCLDEAINTQDREKRSLACTMGIAIIALSAALAAGYKYVDANSEKITAMRESMWAESGHIPERKLTPCEKITRDGIPAQFGRFVASTAGLCKAELAGMNSAPKTIVSFNTEGQL